MKKLLILALVAIVAGNAFAMTDPAFSGDFEYTTMMDFESKTYVAEDNNGSAAVNLNGTVDEWSTVNAEFSADASQPLSLNQFTMTTDVTGALGVDGPAGLSITWGKVSHEAAEYQGVAGYADASFTDETSSIVGLKVAVSVGDNVKIISLIAPGTYLGSDWTNSTVGALPEAVGTVEVQFAGLVEGLDANVFFMYDANTTGFGGYEIGATFGYTMGDLALGLIALYEDKMMVDVFEAGISAAYTLADALTLGLAFASSDFSDFSASSGIGLNATWAAADVLDVFVAARIGFVSDSFGMDGGVIFKLGATSYTLGYKYNGSEFQAPGSLNDGLFVKVKGSF